jgi:hypothetical protein
MDASDPPIYSLFSSSAGVDFLQSALNKPSANGVQVNGVLLDFNHGQVLKSGDVVDLSPKISFKFFSIKTDPEGDSSATLL